MSKKVTLEEIKDRIKKEHGDVVTIVEETYVNVSSKAMFLDKDFGVWPATPDNVTRGMGHVLRGRIKTLQSTKLTISEVELKIKEKHGDVVSIISDSYVDGKTKARFLDKDFGEWLATPKNIMKGRGHPLRGRKNASKAKYYTVDYVKQQIKNTHGDTVLLIEESYIDFSTKCKFLDIIHGIWDSRPIRVSKGVGHPNRERDKLKKTNLERYGVEHNMHSPELALRAARSSNISTIKYHWKTGKELICLASYEAKTVDYFNSNQIDFLWQPQTFKMPDGKTYRPDTYLPDQGIWIEIKGYMRPKSQIK